MRIIGYTFEDDYHCVDCTIKRFGNKNTESDIDNDENQIPLNSKDSEGNLIHPIFSTGEIDKDACCGDCHNRLD